MTKAFVYIVLLLTSFQVVRAQNENILLGSMTDLEVISANQKDLKSITDSATLILALNNVFTAVHSQGYLVAAYGIKKVDSVFQIQIEIGDRFNWAKLKSGNLPDYLLSKIGYKQRFFIERPFKQREIQSLFTKLLQESENNGYPFAAVKLDSVKVFDSHIFGVLNYNQGPEITFDKIQIKSSDKVKPEWLASYLNIKEGSSFNQYAINNITEKIAELSFIELVQSPEITFQNSQATVSLNVKYIAANNIDGIIGFLPNDQKQGKLLVTGQFYLGLENLFSSGKVIDLQWQSLKPRSQLLNATYNHPNILQSKIDMLANFNLLKEDTIFINREGELAAILRKPKRTWKLFYKAKNTAVLSENLNRDDLADVKIIYYGGKYAFKTYATNNIKRRGFGFDIEAAVGAKSIKNNANLPENNYENIDFNSIQYMLGGSFTSYLNLSKYLVIYQRTKVGKLFNDFLFMNDLYRLGGLTTVRGFNENFFFASDYAFSNLELQIHFQSDSYLFAFYDQAYIYYDVNSSKYNDYPLGVGLGLSIKVQKGLINIAYAVGRSKDQSFNLKLSKIHFGYVARF